MLYAAVTLAGIAFLVVTASFPILAYRLYREEGFSLFAVVWGICANAGALLIWIVVLWVWWSVFTTGDMPL